MDFDTSVASHDRHRIGHGLIVVSIITFLIVSLLLSAISTKPAVAFGVRTIFELSNKARQSSGLSTFNYSERLAAAAQKKAEAMVKNNYFAHTAPDGTTGWDFIEEEGYDYALAGENLAASNEDDNAVVDGWMKSPGHRENLLNEKFTDIGIGVAFANQYENYRDVYFIVALYAEPSDQTVVNQTATTTGGITSFSGDRFSINNNTSFLLIALCGLLFVTGVTIELQKIHKHFPKPPAS